MDRRETPKISEGLRLVGGGGRSAEALKAELLDAGLQGGGLETEQRGGAIRAADAPAGLLQRGQDLRALGAGEGRRRVEARGGGGPHRHPEGRTLAEDDRAPASTCSEMEMHPEADVLDLLLVELAIGGIPIEVVHQQLEVPA